MIIEPMIEELRHEAALTRTILERIPEDGMDYKPHTKSMDMRTLGSHIAEMLMWVDATINQHEYVMDMASYVPYKAASKQELLETFDRNLAAAIECMTGTPDPSMLETWTMKDPAGNVFFQLPRVAVLRGFIFSHMIHHRAQLGVYLRLNDLPVPSIYGPSADEGQPAPA